MAQLISSQRYRDPAIVAAKRAAADYAVTVYGIELNGESYDVVIDGHHSLDAAREDGAEPNIVRASGPLEQEFDTEIEISSVEAWLENHYVDAPYYFIATSKDVW